MAEKLWKLDFLIIFLEKLFFHEKIAKNMTFSEKICIFLMFSGIPDVQIPQKQCFSPSERVFEGQKVLKTPENRSNKGVRGKIQYFGRSILTKSEKFIFFLRLLIVYVVLMYFRT